MRKIIPFIVVLFSFAACNLDKLEPAQTKAFMKFFGDVGNTEGVDLLKLDDGYLLLGNNVNGRILTAVLIKTDLNGNQVWSNSFANISASSLAKNANSYFIVGDSIKSDIDSLQYTRMSLIKTDLNGTSHKYTSLGEFNLPYHGTGVTVSSLGEVVVCGYIDNLTSGTDATFLYGYDSFLDPSWDTPSIWPLLNNAKSSKTIFEDVDSAFIWTSLFNDGSTNKIEAVKASRNNPTPTAGIPLLNNESSLSNELGDLSEYNMGGAIIHTVNKTKNSIAAATYISGEEKDQFYIESLDNNYYAGAIIQASDGDLVVLGSTDIHKDGSARSDLDFYITKVGSDGIASSVSGFTNIIGGTGSETGAAIVQADDRGFVFLGTMKNTNDVNTMVLVKVDVRGEMIN